MNILVLSLVGLVGFLSLLGASGSPLTGPSACPSGCRCHQNQADCRLRQLTSIPSCTSCSSVHRLDLSHNFIADLQPEAFVDSPNVIYVNVDNNNIVNIDALAFRNLRHLQEISVEDNELSLIDGDIFNFMPSLSTVSLRGNPLLITSPLPHSDSITSLDLRDCQITSLPSDVFINLKQLEIVFLTGNELTSLPTGIFQNLNRLKRVYLHDNPWRCDGDLEQLMKSKQGVIVDYKKIYCVARDGEQLVWSPGSWKTTPSLTSTEPWIQEALETSSSDVARIVTSSEDSAAAGNDGNKEEDRNSGDSDGNQLETIIIPITAVLIVVTVSLLVVLVLLCHFGYIVRRPTKDKRGDVKDMKSQENLLQRGDKVPIVQPGVGV